MGRFGSASLLRLAGLAGVAGGLGWTGLTLLTFAAGRGASPLGYGTLDALTPVALALAAAGVAGFRARSRSARERRAWGRLTNAGFVALLVGLLGAAAGSLLYVAADRLGGWTVSVWTYFLALVGATILGVGLLWDEVEPRAGAALLAGALPVGLGVSFALAFAGVVPDEAVVPVGPGALLGVGVAALGWWTWRAERRAES